MPASDLATLGKCICHASTRASTTLRGPQLCGHVAARSDRAACGLIQDQMDPAARIRRYARPPGNLSRFHSRLTDSGILMDAGPGFHLGSAMWGSRPERPPQR